MKHFCIEMAINDQTFVRVGFLIQGITFSFNVVAWCFNSINLTKSQREVGSCRELLYSSVTSWWD